MTDWYNVCKLWQSWTMWEAWVGFFSDFQGAFNHCMWCIYCRWWACKTQSSTIKWVSFIYSWRLYVCFFKSFINFFLFLNFSSDRLANNDLLSLDPFGPTLTGGSSYSAPASTGTFYTSSCPAFWIDLFLLNSYAQRSQLINLLSTWGSHLIKMIVWV